MMLQTQMFSSNLGRASSQNIYAILRMLPLAMFLALVLYYSTAPAAFLLQLLYYHCYYHPAAILILLLY